MEKRWAKMSADMILANDKYLSDDGTERHEIVEKLETILDLVD